MGIHGLPPATGTQMSPIGPSDQDLVHQLKSLMDELTALWQAYDKDPTPENEEKLAAFLQQKMLPFFEKNQQQLGEICRNNGWSAGPPMGWKANIQGTITNLESMIMPPNQNCLKMLSETTMNVFSMLTQHSN